VDACRGLPHPEQFAEVQVVLFEDRRHGFALADRVDDLALRFLPGVGGSAGRPRIPHDGVAEEKGKDHGAENRRRDDPFLSHASNASCMETISPRRSAGRSSPRTAPFGEYGR